MADTLASTVVNSFIFGQRFRAENEYIHSTTNVMTPGSFSWVETRDGVQNPRWRSQVELIQDATTNYSRSGKITVTPGRFMMEVRHPRLYGYTHVPNSYWERIEATYGSLPAIPSTSTNAYNSALADFLKNITEATSPFKGGVFLGELKETLKMLRRPASALRDGISTYLKRARNLRRRRGLTGREVRRILANMYLEGTFGWKPLMGDIESAAEAYKKFADRVETSFVKGEAFETISSSNSTGYDGQSYCYWHLSTVGKMTDKLKFKGVVRHDFNGILGDTAERVTQLSGFRLQEFVPTIWELIPGSWVIDYFTNIGDILNGVHGLTANLAWSSLSRWSTSSLEVGRKADIPRVSSVLGKDASVRTSGSPFKAERVNYSRSKPTLTVPNLSLKMAGGWQWVNLAALLAQR